MITVAGPADGRERMTRESGQLRLVSQAVGQRRGALNLKVEWLPLMSNLISISR